MAVITSLTIKAWASTQGPDEFFHLPTRVQTRQLTFFTTNQDARFSFIH